MEIFDYIAYAYINGERVVVNLASEFTVDELESNSEAKNEFLERILEKFEEELGEPLEENTEYTWELL